METYKHRIRYYECDGMGITHHSNYIRIMEEARLDWLEQLGYGFEKMEAEGISSPVLSVTCDYRRTTTFPDMVEVDVKVVKVTPLKLVLGYEMRKEGTVVATASSTHCFLKGGRPISLEQYYPDLYAHFTGGL